MESEFTAWNQNPRLSWIPLRGGVKIWSFRFVGVQEGKEILQKSVLHVQSCCFAY